LKTLENIKTQSDEELVEAIVKTNNTLLFETLYDRYAGLVYNKCYGFAKDGDEAKDLAQDVFLKLFVKLASFMKVEKLKVALELISPEEKMILLLKYQDNLSIKEIESALSIGESAVKMRIKRAKDKLKTVYNENKN